MKGDIQFSFHLEADSILDALGAEGDGRLPLQRQSRVDTRQLLIR